MKPQHTSIFRLGISALLMANLLSFEFASASGPTCFMIFSEQNSIDRTIHDLAAMRISLDQAKAQGTSSIEVTALTSDYRKKEQTFIEYIETNKIMTRQEFSEQVKQEIQKIQNEQKGEQKNESRRRREQEKQIKYTLIDGTRAVFHRIEPGSFKMGERGSQVDVTITKPFDMMATPTTQIIWRTVVELAAQKLAGKNKLAADPSASSEGETFPVEYVSYNEVQMWIKALNGLSQKGEPALVGLIPGHKKGDVYRLPTEAEWEFVVRIRGKMNDEYPLADPKLQLGDHAWYSENSNQETHPVAQRLPLVIDGKDFYDMLGNVSEWVQDRYRPSLRGGTDPQGPGTGSDRVARGGSWYAGAYHLKSAYRFSFDPRDRHSMIGFRLVRTAK